jgi:hypothetical protein
MKQVTLAIPELGLIVGTPEPADPGLALLIGELLQPQGRRAIRYALLVVGIAFAVPLLALVFRRRRTISSPC